MNTHTKARDIVENAARCIPQGYDELDELVAIRKLLRLSRVSEARLRLDLLMDRRSPGWRTRA